jgi:hypothetical protein
VLLRRLAAEQLEDRSLLSATVGFPTEVTDTSAVADGAALVSTLAAASRLKMVMVNRATSGAPMLVQLIAIDAGTHIVRDYSASISFTSTDPSVVLPRAIAFVQGEAFFQVTFNTTGQQTLTARDNSPIPLTASASATVTAPLSATHFAVQLPSQVAFGVPTSVRLTALDSQNRVATNYAARINVSSTDPSLALPGGAITFNQGVASFQVIFNTSGFQNITFADNSSPPITLTASTFVAAQATQLKMVMVNRAPLGTPVLVGLIALDSAQHFARNYSATIALTSTDPRIVLPRAIAFVQGEAFFQVTFNTAGTQSLVARDNSPIPLSASATAAVTSPAAATRFAIQLPTQVSIGVPTSVQLTAFDSQNRVVAGYGGAVSMTSTDLVAGLPGTIRFNQGVASFQVIFNTSGTQTITFTDNSSPPITVTGSTFVAGPATQLQMVMVNQATVGVPVLVQLIATDSASHFARNYSASITLTSTDPRIVLPRAIAFVQGQAFFQVTFNTAGTQTLSARDNSLSPLVASASTAVTAQPVATRFAVQLPTQVSIGIPTSVQLTAIDSQNRTVTNFSAPVTLNSTDPNVNLLSGPITFNQGIASFHVVFNTSGFQTITLTGNTSPLITATARTFVAAPATRLKMVMVNRATQGVPVLVNVIALDSAQHFSRGYSGTITLTSTDPSIVLPRAIAFVQGEAFFQVTFNTLGQQTLTARDNSPIPLSASASAIVTAPQIATRFAIQAPAQAVIGLPIAVQLTALDSQNRTATNFSNPVTMSSSDLSILQLGPIFFSLGIADFQVIFNTPGFQSLTFTDTSSPPLTITTSVNVLA